MSTEFRRALRSNMTPAERRLWRFLSRRQMNGFRFRRQFQIGPYIVDFACPAERLVIEADGGHHADQPSDTVRDEWLASQGFFVMRFWNSDILSSTDVVLQAIASHLSRRKRREKEISCEAR